MNTAHKPLVAVLRQSRPQLTLPLNQSSNAYRIIGIKLNLNFTASHKYSSVNFSSQVLIDMPYELLSFTEIHSLNHGLFFCLKFPEIDRKAGFSFRRAWGPSGLLLGVHVDRESEERI